MVGVTAGIGGRSYMDYRKVPMKLEEFCKQMNERREALIKNPNPIDAYLLSFDAHDILVTIHPWVDGNGRMSRLIMNHIQYEFDLIPTKVVKEDKAEYIQALNDSREEESMVPFQLFMIKEHIKNLRNEIAEQKKSQSEDFAYLETKVDQKGGPEKGKVDQKSGPETRISILQLIQENESITSREMSNRLGINRSAISKHLKKMQEENIIRREGSQKSGRWVIIK